MLSPTARLFPISLGKIKELYALAKKNNDRDLSVYLKDAVSSSHGDQRIVIHTSVITEAAYTGCNDIVKFLIDLGVSPNHVEEETGRSLANIASMTCNRDLLHILFLSDERIDINHSDDNGVSSLHWACENSDIETAVLLTTYKADVNVTDKLGRPPVFYSLCHEGTSMIKFMLDCGAFTFDRNYRDLAMQAAKLNLPCIERIVTEHRRRIL